MRHEKHIHPDELMNPDLTSEIALVGGTLVIVTLLLLLIREVGLIGALSELPQIPL